MRKANTMRSSCLITSPGRSVTPREMNAISSPHGKIILLVFEFCKTRPFTAAIDTKDLGVWHIVFGHNIWTEGAKRILTLGTYPLAVAALKISGADVVETGIASYIVKRMLGLDSAAFSADNNRKLGFVVYFFCIQAEARSGH